MNAHSVKSKVNNVIRSWYARGDRSRYGRTELRLYASVLRAVAHGHPESVAMARQALRLNVRDRRWFE